MTVMIEVDGGAVGVETVRADAEPRTTASKKVLITVL